MTEQSAGVPSLDQIPRRLWITLCLLAFAAFAFFQWGTWRQYEDGQIRGDAVQVFNAMLSRFADGQGMIHVHSDNHFFKNHLMLWLYPIGWLYIICDSLWTYLTPLNVALALAIVPLGLLAWRRTRSIVTSIAICVVYTLSAMTGSMRLSIHPESYLLPGWFLLFYGVETQRLKWIITGFVATVLVKEDSGLWLTIFFAWALVFRRMPWKHAAAFCVAAIGVFVASRAIMNAIPLTGTTNAIGDFWLSRYGDVAASPGELALWMLRNPVTVFQRVAVNGVWLYIVVGAGILCLLGWRELLLMLPPAILFFAATADEFHRALYYYVYPFMPPAFLALIAGCDWVLKRFCNTTAKHRALAGLLVLVALAQLMVPTRVDGWMQFPRALPLAERMRIEIGRDMVRRNVPRDAKVIVAAHYELNQWVPLGRQLVFLRDRDLAIADVAIIDTRRVSADLGRENYLKLLERLQQPDSPWKVVEEIDGLVTLKKQ